MDYPFPTCLDNSFQRVIWIAIGWSIAEIGVSIVQGYEMIGIYKWVIVPPGRESEFLTGWKDMCAGEPSPGPGPSDSHGTLARSGYLDDSEEMRWAQPTSLHSANNSDINIIQEDGEVEVGLRRRFLRNAVNAAAVRLQLEQDLDQLLALKAREEVEEVYGMPAIVSYIPSTVYL